MSLFGSFAVSGSALTAERMRMDLVGANLANQDTLVGPGGRPYQAEEAIFRTTSNGGVEVAGVRRNTAPGPLRYDPSSPFANAAGYVRMPNVTPTRQLVNLMEAARAFQANATVLADAKALDQKLIGVIR